LTSKVGADPGHGPLVSDVEARLKPIGPVSRTAERLSVRDFEGFRYGGVDFQRGLRENAAMPSGKGRLGLIGLLYAVSGALGLVYEVTFSKYLGYVFGATAYASSAVLVAFMGGLALGAAVASRIDRHLQRPLLAYGVAELLIGIFCEGVPLSFTKLSAFYVSFATTHPNALATISVVRALLAMIVVLVPAAGMGATLPLLARFIESAKSSEEPPQARRLLARLYAINTFGGAAGSLASAYWIIPSLGLARTMHVSAAISLAIGAIAIALGLGNDPVRSDEALAAAHEAETEPEKKQEEKAKLKAVGTSPSMSPAMPTNVPIGDALVLGAASGLLVFATEVVFVHLLALVIGTSVYAFGLMLAIFLVCLAAGTPIATRLSARFGNHAIGISFAIAGFALGASLIVWDKLPPLFVALGPIVRSWHGRELVRGLAAFFALVIPVVAMGTSFPLVLRAVRASTVGADVGKLTVANTLGSIGGSIVGGFVLLPRFGSQTSLTIIAVVYLAFALFSVRGVRGVPLMRIAALAGGAILVFILVPKWDLARLTSGANVYFDEGVVPKGVVETMWEDVHGGVTTVVRDNATNLRTLLTNGKFEGNDGPEIQDNRGFAHLPALFAENRRRAMVIGLGTGTSAGTIAAYDFEKIDIVELSPAIIQTARTTFAGVNHHVLADPRVQLFVEDGRNLLLVRPTLYDVVSIELTSIWFAGAANLYSQQFYELVKKRLEPGGVLQQWAQLHHTNRRNLATVLGTVRSAFPHVLLAVVEHQGIIIAGTKPLTVTHQHMRELERLGYVKDALAGRRPLDLVRGIVLDESGIDAFVHDVAEENGLLAPRLVSTDENLFLEYATPRANVPTADDTPDTLAYLAAYRRSDLLKTHVLP
jgi:spermidine synthase